MGNPKVIKTKNRMKKTMAFFPRSPEHEPSCSGLPF
jgi:hypothetical protein